MFKTKPATPDHTVTDAAGDLAVDGLEVSVGMIGGGGHEGRWHSAGRDRADITRDSALAACEADGKALARRLIRKDVRWAVDALAFELLCRTDRRLGEADLRAVVGSALADRWKDRPAPAPAPAPRRPVVAPGRRTSRPGWPVQLEYR